MSEHRAWKPLPPNVRLPYECAGGGAVSEHRAWQRDTAIRKIEESQRNFPAPPLARNIAEAARYVGVEPFEVEHWWKGRGR